MKQLIYVLALQLCIYPAFSQNAIDIDKNGQGDPILFLPGFTVPGSIWNDTLRHLEGEYESHVISYAGFNGLEPIDTPWYSSIKNQLIEYVRNEGLSNLTIIGHSMGGNLAIDLAASLDNQVTGLVLVESIPCMRELMMPGVPASSLQYDSPYNKQILDMTDEAFKQMAKSSSENMTFNSGKIETLGNWIVNADRKTYVYGYTDLLKLDLRETLKGININVLILGASFPDKNVVRANYEKQYTNLSSKEIIIAEDSKHFIMFDQPEWFYEKVNQYLDTNVRN